MEQAIVDILRYYGADPKQINVYQLAAIITDKIKNYIKENKNYE